MTILVVSQQIQIKVVAIRSSCTEHYLCLLVSSILWYIIINYLNFASIQIVNLCVKDCDFCIWLVSSKCLGTLGVATAQSKQHITLLDIICVICIC